MFGDLGPDLVPDLVPGTATGGSGPDVLVLHFPVEIEVRAVAPHDPEALISATLDRLTSALQGLA